jgi:glycine dehydrogenase subunit 1
MKRPGDQGADVAVAEGQPLGIPLLFGGPYLGLFAAKQDFLRRMPGRLVGQTVDAEGRRAFCLTLQTREQHIRREKATSNVCTNQGLMALRASIYMAAMGPQGLRQVAQLCHNKAAYFAAQARATGLTLKFPGKAFFNEELVEVKQPVDEVQKRAIDAGILAGYAAGTVYPELANCLLVAVTEKRTRAEIDRLIDVLK